MSFQGINMTPIGGNARAGQSSLERNAPMGWAYQSSADDLEDVKGTGYFDTFNTFLVAGQFIYVSLTDGKFILTVLSVDRNLKQVTIDIKNFNPGTSFVDPSTINAIPSFKDTIGDQQDNPNTQINPLTGALEAPALNLDLTKLSQTTWTAIGNGLNVSNITRPYIAVLSPTRLVLTDDNATTLQVYDWDGTDWTAVGSALTISGMDNPAVVRLTETRFAYIDIFNKVLQAYEFDGTTIAQVGNDLSLPSISAKPQFAQMTEKWIAFLDGGSDTLGTYQFDGTDWTLIGNAIVLPTSTGFSDICGLSVTRIMVAHPSVNELRAHDFDGVDWSFTASMSITLGANALTALSQDRFLVINNNTSQVTVIDFDGTTFNIGDSFIILGSTEPAIGGLDTNRFVTIGAVNTTLQTYQFSFPSQTALDADKTQQFGLSDAGFLRVLEAEIIHHLLISVADDGHPSLMTRGRAIFGNDVDVWGGKLKQNSFQVIPDNFIFVSKESDFGVASGGEIELKTQMHYRIMKPVTIVNQLAVPVGGLVAISSSDQIINTLVHAQAGGVAWIKGSGIGVLDLMDLQVVQTTNTSQYFDISGAPGSFLRINKCRFTNTDVGGGEMGNISNFAAVDISKPAFINNRSGLSILDCDGQIDSGLLQNPAALGTIFLDLQTTEPHEFEVRNTKIAPRVGESAFDISSTNQDVGSRYLITNCVTRDVDYAVGVIFDDLNQFDPRVNVVENFNIEDSTVSAEARSNISLVTIIPSLNAHVIINGGTSFSFTELNRIVGTTDGVMEVTSLEPAKLVLDGNISVKPDQSGTDIISARFAKIGTEARTVTFNAASNLINDTGTPLSNGDQVSFFNNAGTLPAELFPNIIYFVVGQTANTFQVAYFQNGPVITFGDQGSGVNTYDIAELHGSNATNNISSTSPRDLIPQALLTGNPGDKLVAVLINTTNAADLDVNRAYIRVKK